MNAAKDSAIRATTRPARAEPARAKAARRIDIRLGDWTALQAQAGPIRTAVFVQEQGIAPELEWDENDAHCVHCLALVDGEPAGTGRLLPDGHIGRMAVLPAHRRAGLGSLVLLALMQAAAQRGDARVALSAQTAVRDFYRAHGFQPEGEIYDEVGIPHQAMSRALWGGDITLREWTARGEGEGGQTLQVREWRPARGHGEGLYLLHGLGEHCGRYEALARRLCARGWRVRGHDHVGHGRSAGRRGVPASEDQLGAHARAEFERFAAEFDRRPVLLGHSLGGALAAELVAHGGLEVSGLVLSSPALDPGLGRAQRALAAVLGALAPSLAVGNGLDPEQLSRDPEAVAAYRADPLVHDRVSARLVRWLLQAGARAQAAAPRLAVPTLMLVSGSDRLVDPTGSRRFAAATPKGRVDLRWYAELRHEAFNELAADRERVVADLERWLDALDGRS